MSTAELHFGLLVAADEELRAHRAARLGSNSDLAIAATAIVYDAVLLTCNGKDLKIVDDLVDTRLP